MTLDQELQRAHAAQRIMEDPLVIEAFETLEKSVIDAMKNGVELTADDLTRLWLTLRLTGKLKAWFGGIIATGTMADMELNRRK